MVIIVGVIVIILALLYCVYGYKLARIILPFCGLAVAAFFAQWLLIDILPIVVWQKWLLIGCGIVVIYILLFFLKRVAAFFAGFLGTALFLKMVSTMLNLSGMKFYIPIFLSICLVVGLLSFVYARVGVMAATSLLGAGLLTISLFFLISGNTTEYTGLKDLVVAIGNLVKTEIVLIIVVSVMVSVLSFLMQILVTGRKTVLPGNRVEKEKGNKTKGEADDSSKKNAFV